jgi:O-acetyl-ADP-ribose deacetylase (regulator of RNase III)
MAKIHYIIGDATLPIETEAKNRLIVHCCNTLGVWGAGFVVPLGERYPKAKERYKEFIEENKGIISLGEVNEVKVADNIYVENLIGQSFLYKKANGEIPCNYIAIETGFLNIIRKWLSYYEVFHNQKQNFSIHMPRIGCGLAGGDWKTIENIIQRTFVDIANVDVYVYDLKEQKDTIYDNRG